MLHCAEDDRKAISFVLRSIIDSSWANEEDYCYLNGLALREFQKEPCEGLRSSWKLFHSFFICYDVRFGFVLFSQKTHHFHCTGVMGRPQAIRKF